MNWILKNSKVNIFSCQQTYKDLNNKIKGNIKKINFKIFKQKL